VLDGKRVEPRVLLDKPHCALLAWEETEPSLAAPDASALLSRISESGGRARESRRKCPIRPYLFRA